MKNFKEIILEELNERIDKANQLDEYDVAFELENFRDWFYEKFIY